MRVSEGGFWQEVERRLIRRYASKWLQKNHCIRVLSPSSYKALGYRRCFDYLDLFLTKERLESLLYSIRISPRIRRSILACKGLRVGDDDSPKDVTDTGGRSWIVSPEAKSRSTAIEIA